VKEFADAVRDETPALPLSQRGRAGHHSAGCVIGAAILLRIASAGPAQTIGWRSRLEFVGNPILTGGRLADAGRD
jgi:hypothetical protein